MTLHFETTNRKQMVKAIEAELGIKAKYLGAPSMAYQIGEYRINRDASLEFSDSLSREESSSVIDALVMAGFEPLEWEKNTEDGPEPEAEGTSLTIEMPREKLSDEALENLKKIVESKGGLFKKAFETDELQIDVSDEKVSFPWFRDPTGEAVKAYTHFIAAICEMASTQSRVTATEKEVDNEKYAFRCFLLRLGFIGAQYKAERKVLLKNLTGSSAFKSGKKGGAE